MIKNKNFLRKSVKISFFVFGFVWLVVFFLGLAGSMAGLIWMIKIMVMISLLAVKDLGITGILVPALMFSVFLPFVFLYYLIINLFYKIICSSFIGFLDKVNPIYIKILLYSSAYLFILACFDNFQISFLENNIVLDFIFLVAFLLLDWLSNKIYIKLFKKNEK